MTTLIEKQHEDVKDELQRYIKENEINSLFVSVVEALLIKKPASPIGFIVQYFVVSSFTFLALYKLVFKHCTIILPILT